MDPVTVFHATRRGGQFPTPFPESLHCRKNQAVTSCKNKVEFVIHLTYIAIMNDTIWLLKIMLPDPHDNAMKLRSSIRNLAHPFLNPTVFLL